jgi:flagellar basal-body rod protein FlgF
MPYDVNSIALAASRKLTQLDFISNNLANSSTTGFKTEHMYFSMNGRAAQEKASMKFGPTSSAMDFSAGNMHSTGNPLDVAISGDGFFTVQGKNGVEYTRSGNFVLNSKGELCTTGGDVVLGEQGKIIVNGRVVRIESDGTVNVDGSIAGKLKISAFANPSQIGRSATASFSDKSNKAGVKQAVNYSLLTGSLEESNVNVMKESIEMIDINRSFEAYQKIITTIQDFDKISTNRIGKLI